MKAHGLSIACALVLCASVLFILIEVPVQAGDKVTEEEAANIARDAYIYGYPLVTLEITRRV